MTGVYVAFGEKSTVGLAGWVEDGTGCHIWVGERLNSGYGRLAIDGRRVLAHRARYELEVGPIPEGAVLDHYVCDRGPDGCCNPRHCRPASSRENLLRGDTQASYNLAKTHCPRGHELVGENLSPYHLKKGWRNCLTCAREAKRQRRRLAKGR